MPATSSTSPPSGRSLDELGFYVLAGQPTSSRDALTEARDAEAMG